MPTCARDKIFHGLEVRSFDTRDTKEICSWIRTTEELELVSSDKGTCLTPEILTRWIEVAESTTVITSSQTHVLLGFCTLSRLESPGLHSEFVETCHLIVNPIARYGWIASRLMDEAREVAAELGATATVGRVVPRNRPILAVLGFKGWREFIIRPEWSACNFRWFWAPSGEQALPRQRTYLTG
jgi:GNAT superfamily N-acetyltransferase